jgi:hypothetical protein
MSFRCTVHLSLTAVTRVLIAAATTPIIACVDELTLITLWTQVCMCVSVTLGSRRYTVRLSASYSCNTSCHWAVPVSHLPFTANLHTTFATSCCRKMLQVHLRRQGGSNIAAASWFWIVKKGVFWETPNVSRPWHCSHPCYTWWYQLTEINKHLTLNASVNQVVSTDSFHFLCRPRSMKTRAWFAVWLVMPSLPRSLSPQCSQTYDSLAFHQTWDNTPASLDIVCSVCQSILNTWALMPVLKWTMLRMVCKVSLEGRGNSDQRKV